jgi:hypothetical protein
MKNRRHCAPPPRQTHATAHIDFSEENVSDISLITVV